MRRLSYVHVVFLAALIPYLAAAYCVRPTTYRQSFSTEEGKIIIADRDWTSHTLTSYIVAIILEEALGFEVEVRKFLPDSHAEWFQMFKRGEFHVDFEVWSDNKQDMIAAFERETGVTISQHEASGRSGWYLPSYVQGTSSEGLPTDFYTHLQDPASIAEIYGRTTHQRSGDAAAAERCDSDPSFRCNGTYVFKSRQCERDPGLTGTCAAQLFKGPLVYDQGVVEQQANNLDLNLSVVYMSMEDLQDRIWNAFSRREPVLFYSYSPNGDFSRFLAQSRRIEFPLPPKASLPMVSDAIADATPEGPRDYDFQASLLRKLISPSLSDAEDAEDATRFLRDFKLRDQDYDFLFNRLQLRARDEPAFQDTACDWVLAHQDQWRPHAKISKSYLPFPIRSGCFIWVSVQLGLAVVLMALAICDARLCGGRPVRIAKTSEVRRSVGGVTTTEEQKAPGKIIVENARMVSDTHHEFETKVLGNTDSVQRTVLGGVDHINAFAFGRDKAAFVSDQAAPKHERGPLPAYRQNLRHRREYLSYFVRRHMGRILHDGLAFMLVDGAVATLLHLIWTADPTNPSNAWIKEYSSTFKDLLKDFLWFPGFMLAFFLNKEVVRFMDYLDIANKFQARIHDCGLLAAGCFPPPVRSEDRELLFKLYRWLNSIHVCAYAKFDPRLKALSADELLDQLTMCQLLTPDEEARLVKRNPRFAETLCAWSMELFAGRAREDKLLELKIHEFDDMLCSVRGQQARFPSNLNDFNPNTIASFMFVMLDLLRLMILVCIPFRMWQKDMCPQPFAMLSSYVLYIYYAGGAEAARILLMGPFDPQGDIINIDQKWMATDSNLWMMMRSGFDVNNHGNGAPLESAKDASAKGSLTEFLTI